MKKRPGKYVSAFELQVARWRMWDRTMEAARWAARHRGERARVVGVQDKYGRWTYVVECASWCPCRQEVSR